MEGVRDIVQSVGAQVVFASGRGVLRNLEYHAGVSSFLWKGERLRCQNGCIR